MAISGKFNRIINLYFYKKENLGIAGKVNATSLILSTTIKTPTKGIKPDIEINGNFTNATYLPVFNIAIKNLYLNLNEAQYSQVRVEAGYENNLISFTGTILSLYQESPGPDGVTRIQCINGNLDTWLSKTVNLNFDEGTKLSVILSNIASTLNCKNVSLMESVQNLSLTEKFEFQGKAAEAINQLQKIFENEKLMIKSKDSILYALSIENKESIGSREIKFISAPPQQNPGDEDGVYYTVVTAPWEPGLQCGDKLIYPSWQYVKNYQTVKNASGKSAICVQGINFQFSTVGGANSMTVQGYGV